MLSYFQILLSRYINAVKRDLEKYVISKVATEHKKQDVPYATFKYSLSEISLSCLACSW